MENPTKTKKPFGETKFGQFLSKAAKAVPEVAGVALDLIGGDVGDAIDKVKDALGRSNSPEAKALQLEFEKERNNFLLEMERLRVEEEKLHQADRESARQREIARVNAGVKDHKQTIVLAVGLAAFAGAILATLFVHVPDANRESWVHLMGVIEGAAAIPIFTYFFGSSSGSKQKTELLKHQ